MRVKKRDGRIVEFNKEKIKRAIEKAYNEEKEMVSEKTLDLITEKIVKHCKDNMEVEEIQNLVENELMLWNSKVAKSYIRYRYKRETARNYKDDFFKAIGEKLEGKNIQNQNANVDEASFGGRMGEANSLLMKKYALEYIISPMGRKNHEENMIYIHDLDHYAVGDHNCLSIPFDDLLAKGFNTRQTDIRPANSISTAFQLVAVIFQLQSLQQFG